MSALDQARLVREKKVSALELLDAAIERYETYNPKINAVNIVWLEHARELASRADAKRTDDPSTRAPFFGVPTLFKDLGLMYAGQPLSQGNKATKAINYVPQQTSELAARFIAAGFIPFGRTNSCEWGSLPVTEPEAWGATRNPHDLSRTCGGSSGGAGSAVAAGIVALAHASDGGGSIRIPASCNGLVGLKPSRGRISMAPLGDEAGFSVQLAVTHTVADTAALLDAVHGPGVGDGVVAPPPERPFIQEVGASVGSLRIGLLDHDPHGVHVDVECRDAARNTAKLLESLGHHVEESWPDALNDASFPPRFGAMWATTQAVSRDSLSALLGRPATKDDIEAVNWEQAERASKASALRNVPTRRVAMVERRVRSPRHANALTHTLPHRIIRQRPERPAQALTPGERMGALHRTIQHVGATSDQPAARSHRDWAARRRATRGRLWARRPVVASGGATRICCPVEEFFAHRTRLTSRWANGHPLD